MGVCCPGSCCLEEVGMYWDQTREGSELIIKHAFDNGWVYIHQNCCHGATSEVSANCSKLHTVQGPGESCVKALGVGGVAVDLHVF